MITIGYTLADRISLFQEVSTLLTQYPGMVDAAIGTGLLILVVVSSLVIVRQRRLFLVTAKCAQQGWIGSRSAG